MVHENICFGKRQNREVERCLEKQKLQKKQRVEEKNRTQKAIDL